MVRSVHPTSSFHSIGMAARNATNGRATAATLTFRCVRLIASEGYALEARFVQTSAHDLGRNSCSFPSNGRRPVMGGASSRGGRRAAARAAGARGRDHRGHQRRGSGLRPPARGALRSRAPHGRRREVEVALGNRRAALGPTVLWPEAAISFGRAREVLRLMQDGAIEDGRGLLVAERHNLSLLLGADRRLARDVVERALAPFDGETELSRDRLRTTLEAWLRHRGRTEAVARALHVHPQTVRYRVARLRELFGPRLDDPDGRFELELALRSRLVTGTN